MEVFNELIDFFGISSLTSDATFIELVNYVFSVSVAVFIVCFIIRSFFLICEVPNRLNW